MWNEPGFYACSKVTRKNWFLRKNNTTDELFQANKLEASI
jgi:hypothetical protein